jgi:hypothetical protein
MSKNKWGKREIDEKKYREENALSLPQQVSDHAIVFVLLDRRHQFHAVWVLLDQAGARVLVVEASDLGAGRGRRADEARARDGMDGWRRS